MKRALCLGIGAMLWAQAAPLLADEPDRAAAEVLFERGKERLAAGDDDGACKLFAASRAIEATPSSLIKVARCQTRMGRHASAWMAYVDAEKLNHGEPDEARRIEIQSVIDREKGSARGRAAHVTVRVEGGTDDVVVVRGTTRLPRAALGEALPVDPGEVVVIAGSPGHIPSMARALLVEGERREVRLRLEEESKGTGEPMREVRQTALRDLQDERSSSPWPTVGVALLGAGGATLLVAGGFTIATYADVAASDGECDSANRCSTRGRALREDASTTRDVAVGLGIAGALTAGAGLTVLLTPVDVPPGRAARAVRVSALGVPAGGGLSLSGAID